jgi:hypothetical protein
MKRVGTALRAFAHPTLALPQYNSELQPGWSAVKFGDDIFGPAAVPDCASLHPGYGLSCALRAPHSLARRPFRDRR